MRERSSFNDEANGEPIERPSGLFVISCTRNSMALSAAEALYTNEVLAEYYEILMSS